MPNLHECNACGHTYDKDMYEVCPECQRHPDDDINEDVFALDDDTFNNLQRYDANGNIVD